MCIVDNSVILLEKGQVYFYVGFTDPTFTVPLVSTWLYLGKDKEFGHLFKSASDDKEQYCFPEGKELNVLDKKALIEWLSVEHYTSKAGKSYQYKNI